jgi:hypothetical protein
MARPPNRLVANQATGNVSTPKMPESERVAKFDWPKICIQKWSR